ncbi:MAG: RHS repeat protein [Prevotella sp.]|nr:RHS repeat protein [Prevotella sp.]
MLPNGYTIHYEYDGFGRLTTFIDHDGNVISTNSYNYGRS